MASERLPLAPTPCAIISGTRPNTMDNTVINMGRRRTFAALYAACASVMPSDRRLPAYSVSSNYLTGMILLIDLAVGLVVACTVYGFYALFSRGEI